MNSADYRIRPYVEADYDAESRVRSLLRPDQVRSAEEIRAWDRQLAGPGMLNLRLAAEDRRSGTAIGFGALFHFPWAYHPDRYWITVAVAPDHQHRGVGRELYGALEVRGRERRAECFYASVRADEARSLRFFSQAGFQEMRRIWNSRLDLGNVRLAARTGSSTEWSRAGVEFTTLAEEGPDKADVQQRLYDLASEVGLDIPTVGRPTRLSFAQFNQLWFGSPGFLTEGTFLATSGARYVAVSSLSRLSGEPDALRIEFTGVRREFRGQGLASELKRRTVDYAQRHHIRFLRASNDSQNVGIWRINERLGFQVEQVYVDGRKDLTSPL